MLLTDAEARQQSCPFFRFVVNESDVSQWNKAPIYVHQNCMGSDCKISWRWVPVTYANGEPEPPKYGYCGIAGKPHGAT